MWGTTRVHSGTFTVSQFANDMPQAVKSNLFPYANGSCLVFQGKDTREIEKQLNGGFTNIREWFVYNRLSITKSITKIRLNLYFLILNVK